MLTGDCLAESAINTCRRFFCLAVSFMWLSSAYGLPPSSESEPDVWETLFDGETTDSWREVGSSDFPADVWVVEDGCLRLLPNKCSGKDLISLKQYNDFELRFEWKISKNGNSGIKYLVSEHQADPDQARMKRWALTAGAGLLILTFMFFVAAYRFRMRTVWIFFGAAAGGLAFWSFLSAWHFSMSVGNAVGLEFQLYDDFDVKIPDKNVSTGALYDLFAPEVNAVLPAGEFNSGRIIVAGTRVEHWINGTRILTYELESPALKEKIARSKFHATPDFGNKSAGHVSLQNHGDGIWFRTIKIRSL